MKYDFKNVHKIANNIELVGKNPYILKNKYK